MYDPHRLRHNDRRYFTRKGQIIQAKAVNPPFTIEANKVDAYKEYIIKNRLIPSQIPLKITSVKVTDGGGGVSIIPMQDFTYISEDTLVDLPDGVPSLCFCLSEFGTYYNFNIFLATNHHTFPHNTYYAHCEVEPNSNILVYFQANGVDVFNGELAPLADYILRLDIELLKSHFVIINPS